MGGTAIWRASDEIIAKGMVLAADALDLIRQSPELQNFELARLFGIARGWRRIIHIHRDGRHGLVDLADDDGRQAARRLVEDQQARLADHALPHCQDLLLPARQA